MRVSIKLSDLIELIVDKSGKSKEEVVKLIETKKSELDGYVTDEGAASLVARELDLDLFEKQPDIELKISVRDLVSGMTGVSMNLKVIRIFPVHTFTRRQGGEGKVASMIGADSTGSVRVTFWGNHTQPIEDREIDEGDILRIINGRVKTGLRDQLEIHLGSGSRIMRNPPDIDPNEFPDVTLPLIKITSLEEGMGDVYVKGTVFSKFRKITFSREDSEGIVASLSLGDDTGRTRLVLWDEQADWFDKLEIGDQIQIEGGYVRLDRNNVPELHMGRRGRITPLEGEGETLPEPPSAVLVPLKEIRVGEYVTVEIVVLENQGISTFVRKDGREGKRLVLTLADGTGKVRAVAWGRAAEDLADLKEGTHLRLENVGTRMGFRQEIELHINASSRVIRNPPNLKISKPSSKPLHSKPSTPQFQWLSEVIEGNHVTICGTVVQVIHQRTVYDACPKCSRKVSINGKSITCPKCGAVEQSIPRLIAKIVIDDGTDNMRASFIGTSAETLLGITGAEAKTIIEKSGKDDEPISHLEDSLLGKELVLSGRIGLNNFTNELEIAVNQIQEADPVEVANRLIKELERKNQV